MPCLSNHALVSTPDLGTKFAAVHRGATMSLSQQSLCIGVGEQQKLLVLCLNQRVNSELAPRPAVACIVCLLLAKCSFPRIGGTGKRSASVHAAHFSGSRLLEGLGCGGHYLASRIGDNLERWWRVEAVRFKNKGTIPRRAGVFLYQSQLHT